MELQRQVQRPDKAAPGGAILHLSRLFSAEERPHPQRGHHRGLTSGNREPNEPRRCRVDPGRRVCDIPPTSDENIEEQLFRITEENYGPTYRTHLIEIYKLYVEMADRVSSRRQAANSFYLTVNTAIIGAATFFQVSTSLIRLWLVAVAGAALCLMWIRNIQSYKDLNLGKLVSLTR